MALVGIATLATLAAAQQAPPPQPAPTLRIPAFCGYAHPDPDAARRRDDGSVARCDGELHFYIRLTHTGPLTIGTDGTQALTTRITTWPDAHDLAPAPRATFAVEHPGYHRIAIATADHSPIRDLAAITLSGAAAADALTSTVERRNCASVHLAYDTPREHRDDVEWFYCELTPRADPLYTYYMATGFRRGYFGMQVNSPTERRVIFSVWDAGDEAVDRTKVAADDRVQLVAKGDGVVAEGFGHEGTGGHSHLVHDWRRGDTQKFLVHAEPDADGTHTTYTGWFWFTDRGEHGEHDQHGQHGQPGAWGLIASFRAPKDGTFLHGLYSFTENFGGQNGDEPRDCEFGNVWVRTHGGDWLPLRTARFTHDGHGKDLRLDRWGGTRDDRFFLHSGGFTEPPPGTATHSRDTVTLPGESPRSAKPPADPLPKL